MPENTQYYEYCELIVPKRYIDGKPNPTYYKMTYNVWSNKWYNKFKQSWFNRDTNKYNKCLIRSRDGRAKAEVSLDCSLDQNKKKYECKVQVGANTAISDPNNATGKTQTGLGDGLSSYFNNVSNEDKKILIGGALVAFYLVMRN